jgi:CBS domain-containing protein
MHHDTNVLTFGGVIDERPSTERLDDDARRRPGSAVAADRHPLLRGECDSGDKDRRSGDATQEPRTSHDPSYTRGVVATAHGNTQRLALSVTAKHALAPRGQSEHTNADGYRPRSTQRRASMPTAHDILRFKGRTVHAVRPDDTVLAALGVMAEHDIGAVIVLDGNELAGILTERDYARKVVLVGRASKDSPVRAIMTAEVVCVPPNRTVDDCMALMTQHRVRHLPVVDNGQVIGLVSIGDLVKATIDEQEFTINQLKNYIAV